MSLTNKQANSRYKAIVKIQIQMDGMEEEWGDLPSNHGSKSKIAASKKYSKLSNSQNKKISEFNMLTERPCGWSHEEVEILIDLVGKHDKESEDGEWAWLLGNGWC